MNAILSFGMTLMFVLVSCTPTNDFERAVHVGDAVLPDSPVIHSKTNADPNGKFIFALPDGACSPIKAGVIRFEINSGGEVFVGSLDIADLTWSHAKDSCDTIGYLDIATAKAQPENLEVKKFIESQTYAISSIKLDMSGVSVAGQRKFMVWLIYGDRVPSAKIWAGRTNQSDLPH